MENANNTPNDQRMERISAMMVEMARGNFDHIIERSGRHDELEAVAAELNMLAEELDALKRRRRAIRVRL